MTVTAISHRGMFTMAGRVAVCLPEALHERVLALAAGMETRIADKVDQLDF